MKLLRATLHRCGECHGKGRIRTRSCRGCGGKGYRVEDRSIEAPEPAPAPPAPRKSPVQRDARSRRERLADGHCGECGNPDLQTRTRCRACAEYHREINQLHRKTFPTP